MTAPRPVCVHCGKVYGSRCTTTEVVRWDTPSEKSERIGTLGGVSFRQTGDIPPPPPYVGNGIVVKQSTPYVSADNGRAVMERHVWDGVTWWGGYNPFCTLRCALDYARQAYRAQQNEHNKRSRMAPS